MFNWNYRRLNALVAQFAHPFVTGNSNDISEPNQCRDDLHHN